MPCVAGGLHLVWCADRAWRGVLRWQEVVYIASLATLVNDDLKLMSWLKNFDQSKAKSGDKEKQ
jgi:hypothetical protein